jgi:hypothetical protein
MIYCIVEITQKRYLCDFHCDEVVDILRAREPLINSIVPVAVSLSIENYF